MTLTEALIALKNLKERRQDLISLRNENSSITTRILDSRDRVITPTYDAQDLDQQITALYKAIRELDAAIKRTNAQVELVDYDKTLDDLDELLEPIVSNLK